MILSLYVRVIASGVALRGGALLSTPVRHALVTQSTESVALTAHVLARLAVPHHSSQHRHSSQAEGMTLYGPRATTATTGSDSINSHPFQDNNVIAVQLA